MVEKARPRIQNVCRAGFALTTLGKRNIYKYFPFVSVSADCPLSPFVFFLVFPAWRSRESRGDFSFLAREGGEVTWIWETWDACNSGVKFRVGTGICPGTALMLWWRLSVSQTQQE